MAEGAPLHCCEVEVNGDVHSQRLESSIDDSALSETESSAHSWELIAHHELDNVVRSNDWASPRQDDAVLCDKQCQNVRAEEDPGSPSSVRVLSLPQTPDSDDYMVIGLESLPKRLEEYMALRSGQEPVVQSSREYEIMADSWIEVKKPIASQEQAAPGSFQSCTHASAPAKGNNIPAEGTDGHTTRSGSSPEMLPCSASTPRSTSGEGPLNAPPTPRSTGSGEPTGPTWKGSCYKYIPPMVPGTHTMHSPLAGSWNFTPFAFVGQWVDSAGQEVSVIATDAYRLSLSVRINWGTRRQYWPWDTILQIRLGKTGDWVCGNCYLNRVLSCLSRLCWWRPDGTFSVWIRTSPPHPAAAMHLRWPVQVMWPNNFKEKALLDSSLLGHWGILCAEVPSNAEDVSKLQHQSMDSWIEYSRGKFWVIFHPASKKSR